MSDNQQPEFYETFGKREPLFPADATLPERTYAVVDHLIELVQALAMGLSELVTEIRAKHDAEQGPVLTVAEAAQYLSVSERTVWGLIAAEQLDIMRIGERSTRVTRASLDNYVRRLAARRAGK